MPLDYVDDLRSTVVEAAGRLRTVGEAEAARRPAPGKWSAKEIIGHLVDSAANNHQRFVRGQLQEDLVFAGYAQDDWVGVQRYQEAPWLHILDLWCAFNLHIAHVMEAMSEQERLRARRRHNLHEIALVPVPPEEPATLDYLMRDYVRHLHHHLAQVDTLLEGVLHHQAR